MMRRIRTSRILEYACRHNIDFIWLAEGPAPDHSKLAGFFSPNRAPLKSLFKQVCKMAMTIGLVRHGTVAFDATRVKSANGRFNTPTAATIEKPETMLTDGGNAAGSVLAGLGHSKRRVGRSL